MSSNNPAVNYRRQFGFAIVLLLIASVTACDTTRHRLAWQQVYGIPVNSTVTVHRQLAIAPRDTQVFLQEGSAEFEKGLFGGYNDYYPFCYFELVDISNTEQFIEPDRFKVTEVYRDETDIIVQAPQRPTNHNNVGSDADYGIDLIVQLTVMRLYSSRQPDVKMLVCAGGFDLPPFARLPTVEEIRLALGDIATLTLAGE